MAEMISYLKDKINAPDRLIEILSNNFSGFPLHMLMNTLNNKSKSKYAQSYTQQIKEFSLTLYFYSPKAYNFLRKSQFSLPNPSTIRKWIGSFNCSPGFLEEVFTYLKNNVTSQSHLQHVNLVFDGISIRSQLIYDHKKGENVGYIDLGYGIKVGDQEELATESLVFQIVSLKGNFKCAIGYFLTNSLTSNVLSQLIQMAIVKLKEVGVNVHNITFDGTTTNISAVQKLGCKLPENPFLNIKDVDHEICVMLDACHMLKLCRNTLADKKVIISGNGKKIEFRFIESLLELQTKEGLKLSNKLSQCHVFYRNKKMNVKIAAQLLSASVANALEFLNKSNDSKFFGCEETVTFIRIIDRLFDYFNSRDPWGKHFKEPIKKSNIDKNTAFLLSSYEYLKGLKVDGISILDHARKTFVLGFLTNINSIKILTNRLINDLNFKYILTYKFSQDHIELLFSCIRARGGNNNNPNVNQFRQALRKLMFRNSVQAPKGSNCLEFDIHHQNCIMSFNQTNPSQLDDNSNQEEDEYPEELFELLRHSNLSYFKENILYYISGYVVRKVDNAMKCEQCKYVLYDKKEEHSNKHSEFTSTISRGKLIKPSQDVYKLVTFMYKLFICKRDERRFNTKECIILACRHFKGELFKDHLSNCEFGDDSHELKLIKLIGNIFYKTICYSYAKEKTSLLNKRKLGVRQKLNKIVLFMNV